MFASRYALIVSKSDDSTDEVLRVDISYTIPDSHDGGNAFTDWGVSTVGANWCKAKDRGQMPANWWKQDNRVLRTSSMCKEAPWKSSLGEDISTDGSAGEKSWTTPADFNFTDGRWVFSINFWTGTTVHHADGNHTSLWMQEIENGKPVGYTIVE